MSRYHNEEASEGDALAWLLEGVADLYPWLDAINQKLEAVLSNQDELDARAARIEAADSRIEAEIADLKAQVAAGTPAEQLDFSKLDAAVGREEGLAPAVAPPAPVDPAVTPLDNAVAGNAGGTDQPVPGVAPGVDTVETPQPAPAADPEAPAS